jgi:hypothetical protein
LTAPLPRVYNERKGPSAEALGHRCRDWVIMALGFYFTPSSFSTADYDEVIKQLDAAGAGSPDGRLHHIALESDGNVQVFDVWESQEKFEAFGGTLVPIMTGLGANPGEPMVTPVHNIINA